MKLGISFNPKETKWDSMWHTYLKTNLHVRYAKSCVVGFQTIFSRNTPHRLFSSKRFSLLPLCLLLQQSSTSSSSCSSCRVVCLFVGWLVVWFVGCGRFQHRPLGCWSFEPWNPALAINRRLLAVCFGDHFMTLYKLF